MNKKGFSLIEVLLYLGILTIVAVVFFRVLSVSTRVQVSEVASNEVANQVNFVMQTIQRLVRESSAIMVSNSTACIDTPDSVNDNGALVDTDQPCLKLRMKDTERDPIYIWKESDGTITMKQGAGTASPLITPKVQNVDNQLSFKKFVNSPARDTVEIALTLNYNTTNSQSVTFRTARSAVNRASAATFDSALLPPVGATLLDIGSPITRWANLYLSGNADVGGNLTLGGTINQGGNYGPVGPPPLTEQRGYMYVGAPGGQTCSAICAKHTGSCAGGFKLYGTNPFAETKLALLNSCNEGITGLGGFCFCD